MVKGKGGGDTPKKQRQGAKGAAPSEPEKAKAAAEPSNEPKSTVLTEDQQQALFFNHKALYEKHLATKKAADAEFRNACKLIKAEGGDVRDIKDAIDLDTREGELAARAQIERKLQIARWVGADFGHQFSLLPDLEVKDKAFQLGKIEGLKGTPKKPPYDASVPQYKAWMDGYSAGQAVLVKKFAPPAPTPPSPPKADNVVPIKEGAPVH